MITAITGFSAQNKSVTNADKMNNQPSFKGLTVRFGKKAYGVHEITEIFPKNKAHNLTIGTLPQFIRQRIQRGGHDIETATREIYSTVSEACEELRNFEPTAQSTMREMSEKRSDTTVKKMEDVLLKYNVVKPWDEFNIRYLDKGGKGSVYKLEGLHDYSPQNDDELVIKVYHSKAEKNGTFHGCYPELNIAAYWMKHLGYDTNRGKFFWGDANEAYMVNKYIDADVRLPKKTPDPYMHGMKFTDENAKMGHNTCKGYSYDWGGGVVINQVMNSNGIARKIARNIRKQDEKYQYHEWYKIYARKIGGCEDSKYAGLAISLQFLKPDKRIQCFNRCMEKRGKYTDRGLGYALKYLPHDVAKENFEKLMSTTKDPIVKRILVNEIPLLSLNDECRAVKDDLININGLRVSGQGKTYNLKRISEYQNICAKYKVSSFANF